MKTYTIKRNKWVRGNDDKGGECKFPKLGQSQLLNRLGNMCCLGQICKQEGVPDFKILDIESPFALQRKDTPELFLKNHYIFYNMMKVNDHPNCEESEREAKLKALARAVGFKLAFVDS